METKEVALRLQGVKKRYRLGQIGGGTLTADLQSWWARVRGKEEELASAASPFVLKIIEV